MHLKKKVRNLRKVLPLVFKKEYVLAGVIFIMFISQSTVLADNTAAYEVTQRINITNYGPGSIENILIEMLLIKELQNQKVVKRDFSVDVSMLLDNLDNNLIALLYIDNILENETKTITVTQGVVVNEVVFNVDNSFGGIPEEMKQFTIPTSKWESNSLSVINIAREIIDNANATTTLEKVKSAFEWVKNNINYTCLSEEHSALWVINNRKGGSIEFANAMIALSRSIGIPARQVFAFKYDAAKPTTETFHSFVEIYLPNVGWVPFDPLENMFGRLPDTYISVFTRGYENSRDEMFDFSFKYTGTVPTVIAEVEPGAIINVAKINITIQQLKMSDENVEFQLLLTNEGVVDIRDICVNISADKKYFITPTKKYILEISPGENVLLPANVIIKSKPPADTKISILVDGCSEYYGRNIPIAKEFVIPYYVAKPFPWNIIMGAVVLIIALAGLAIVIHKVKEKPKLHAIPVKEEISL